MLLHKFNSNELADKEKNTKYLLSNSGLVQLACFHFSIQFLHVSDCILDVNKEKLGRHF